MKRKSKKTFFELKVTFYFDLFRFFIGGMYDEKGKSIHLSLIPFFVIKLENGSNLIKGKIESIECLDGSGNKSYVDSGFNKIDINKVTGDVTKSARIKTKANIDNIVRPKIIPKDTSNSAIGYSPKDTSNSAIGYSSKYGFSTKTFKEAKKELLNRGKKVR
jgi:hypothetical protein